MSVLTDNYKFCPRMSSSNFAASNATNLSDQGKLIAVSIKKGVEIVFAKAVVCLTRMPLLRQHGISISFQIFTYPRQKLFHDKESDNLRH